MYIRMGPTDDQKDKLHLDDVVLRNREAANKYIHQLEKIRDTLWPLPAQEWGDKITITQEEEK